MKTISKALMKGTIGTVAAGAMAMTSASPAFARHRDNDRIDAGDVIAGAVILGGIAAIASAVGKDRNRGYRYDSRYRYRDRDYRYGDRRGYRRGSPRRAVEKCVRAAERDARRSGYRYSDVTQIRDVDRTRYGWRVKGRIVVDGQHGYGNRYRARYDDRRYDYGRYRDHNYDRGRFSCHIERGRVVDIDYRGIRGLR